MFKNLVVLCLLFYVVVDARPKWQFLPQVPGYVPVYIQAGDTPLEEINPDLAEAFHALPAGRSAGKLVEAAADVPDTPELSNQPQSDDVPEFTADHIVSSPYEKRSFEKKTKKAQNKSEIPKPTERR